MAFNTRQSMICYVRYCRKKNWCEIILIICMLIKVSIIFVIIEKDRNYVIKNIVEN